MNTIEYNYLTKTLTVTMADGSITIYEDSLSYLEDWPDREADCVAIGWTL
jgi:hypothetical protein